MSGIQLGVEVLLAEALHLIDGARVGLITNHTGVDHRGTSTVNLLDRAGIRLAALFAPEHGFRGTTPAGEPIRPSAHEVLGIPIYSLYGETRAPTARMLRRVDCFIYDIQDIGARTFTYPTTMALAAEAAGKSDRRFLVLDRPNPVRADRVEGGVPAAGDSSVGLLPIPQRYGLTPGELLRYLLASGRITADATVVPMRGYNRAMWHDHTGLRWARPSPNIPEVESALFYAGTVFFEATNLSVGRGTSMPFHAVGAPWLGAAAVADELNALDLPGVRFEQARSAVEPGHPYGGSTIPMVRVSATNRDIIRPIEVGAHMLRTIYGQHRAEFEWRGDAIDGVPDSSPLRLAVERGTVGALLAGWAAEAAEFRTMSAPHQLYE